MICFVAIKTLRKEPFPNVLGIKDSLEEALEVIYNEVDKDFKEYYNLELSEDDKVEIENEIEENKYYDFKGYRYSISKYWE